EPEVYYMAADGISKMPCTRQDALVWFMKSFFKGKQLFALRTQDGKEGEWRTLDQLIARNGKDMPFLELPAEREDMNEEDKEEIRKQREALKHRGLQMRREMNETFERLHNAQKNSSRVEKEEQKETDDTPSETDDCVVVVPSSSDSAPAPVVYPQLSPPRGVDPFALLRGCVGAKRKMGDDFVDRFRKLNDLYERCDKERLRQQTQDMFPKDSPRMCVFCKVKIINVNAMIMHFCGSKHVFQIRGSVCAYAFDFWWKAVEESDVQPSEGIQRDLEGNIELHIFH
ncbi:hypothetical protein PMAYCL1PPCAC_08140, partial [Pristionchus mayeri]